MIRVLLAVAIALLVLSCSPTDQAPAQDSQSHQSATPAAVAGETSTGSDLLAVDDTALQLPDGRVVPTQMHTVAVIGRVEWAGRQLVVIEGTECTDCDAPPSVLVFDLASPPSGPRAAIPGWHAFPGRLLDGDSERLLSEARLFWGTCLQGRPAGMVEFRVEYAAGQPARRLVRISEATTAGRIVERTFAQEAAGAPQLTAVERAVKQGRCQEVAPRELSAY